MSWKPPGRTSREGPREDVSAPQNTMQAQAYQGMDSRVGGLLLVLMQGLSLVLAGAAEGVVTMVFMFSLL